MNAEPVIYIGQGESPRYLALRFANRHGLIAGATGTGKTVSLQILAEGLSAQGVPVFMADVKGDLAGVSRPGGGKPKLEERAKAIGLADFAYRAFPTVFWDLLGEQGHPIRATVSEMGPLLLARLLELNDTQAGVLAAAFKFADDQGLLLLDLKDLQSLLAFVADHARELMAAYGNISRTTVGAIQRQLLVLEQQGGDRFFGEPALALADFLAVVGNGMGRLNVLAADRLIESPRLYATFLLWLLSELFEELPEIGDPDKPRLVFFFDEAHLLFEEAPKPLLEKVEQVVRLIRSKGVGVFFVTQNPLDVPDTVLGQLGNRIQHALRAFTPRDQKAVRAAADTFRPNPKLEVSRAIVELGVGEALVSMLEEGGVPAIVQRTLVRPPSSRLGAVTPAERQETIAASPAAHRYDRPIDRDSAYEELARRADQAASPPPSISPWGRSPDKEPAPPSRRTARTPQARAPRPSNRQTVGEALAKSVARSVGTTLGREILRGILGSLRRSR